MTLTELRDLRRKGFVPKSAIIIWLGGPDKYQNPVIKDLVGDFNVFAGLSVYLNIGIRTSWSRVIKIVDRLTATPVMDLALDSPETKMLIQIISHYKRDIHDNSWCYDLMTTDIQF